MTNCGYFYVFCWLDLYAFSLCFLQPHVYFLQGTRVIAASMPRCVLRVHAVCCVRPFCAPFAFLIAVAAAKGYSETLLRVVINIVYPRLVNTCSVCGPILACVGPTTRPVDRVWVRPSVHYSADVGLTKRPFGRCEFDQASIRSPLTFWYASSIVCPTACPRDTSSVQLVVCPSSAYERASERLSKRTIERSSEPSRERARDRPIERANDRAGDRVSDRASERRSEKQANDERQSFLRRKTCALLRAKTSTLLGRKT